MAWRAKIFHATIDYLAVVKEKRYRCIMEKEEDEECRVSEREGDAEERERNWIETCHRLFFFNCCLEFLFLFYNLIRAELAFF